MNNASHKTPTAVLTGATGFLGSHLCRALLEQGYRVHAYRRLTSNPWRLGDGAGQVQWHTLPEALEAPFLGEIRPDVVIHCAALYGRKGEPASELIQVNTLLPVQLYTLAAAHGVATFLHVDTALPPTVNAYALSKHQAAAWLRQLAGPSRVVNLKLHHFYGPRDDPSKFVTFLIRQCLAGVPEILLTEGQQRRDFIYVDDVVAAVQAVLAASAELRAEAERFVEYEVGSGQAIEVRALAGRIHELTHSRARLRLGALPLRPDEPAVLVARLAALQALGWRPRVSLEEGLRRTIAAELSALKPV